ncbi:MAG: cell envelope integrity protein TolA [Gemmataceae bacterium]|nr:cell envelope integrity protein TolA [Gemmataceae bacterium]MBY0514581.1 cell envelope integrity protein TolA [Gemmataceae bacterium]
MDQSQIDKLRGHPILLVASLTCCFPVGLALIWTNKSWSNTRKGVWTGVWAAVMAVLMIVVSLQEAATKKSLDEADRLWAAGQKAEAVAKYKEVIDGGVSSVDQSRRPTVFQRVVEYEAEQGNTSAAKQYIQKAETYNVALASDAPAAKKLLAEAKAEKDAEKQKEARKTAKGDELKGMSLGQITNLLGSPDETYQSRKPPNNMYLYVWKVEEGKYITVSFMRRIDNGEASIITADSDRPRSVVENMKKVLDQN